MKTPKTQVEIQTEYDKFKALSEQLETAFKALEEENLGCSDLQNQFRQLQNDIESAVNR